MQRNGFIRGPDIVPKQFHQQQLFFDRQASEFFQINAHLSPIVNLESRTSPFQESNPLGSISSDLLCQKGLLNDLRQIPTQAGTLNGRMGSVPRK